MALKNMQTGQTIEQELSESNEQPKAAEPETISSAIQELSEKSDMQVHIAELNGSMQNCLEMLRELSARVQALSENRQTENSSRLAAAFDELLGNIVKQRYDDALKKSQKLCAELDRFYTAVRRHRAAVIVACSLGALAFIGELAVIFLLLKGM